MINLIMSILLQEKEQSLKYDLLKQSLNEELSYKLNKNYSFSNSKETYYLTKYTPRNLEQELSDWNADPSHTNKPKHHTPRFTLPQMKNKHKNQNFQELSRELLKYEQFSTDQINENNKFKLSFLRQMTKINFKKQSLPKGCQSPKKVNIKLQFPKRYQQYQSGNEENKNHVQTDLFKNSMTEQMVGSFYYSRKSKGLIPSIKKLVSVFPKKSIFRSESEKDSFSRKKLVLNKLQQQNPKKSIEDEIQQKFMQKQKAERERRVKLARIERRLPLNFLSYSHRKQNIEKEDNQQKTETQKPKKSPYFCNALLSSYYPKKEKVNEEEIYQNKRLSECILLNANKKKRESN